MMLHLHSLQSVHNNTSSELTIVSKSEGLSKELLNKVGTAPKPKLSVFCVLPQIYQHFISIMKQIVWETQEWH